MTARIVWVLLILSSIGAVHAAPQRENTPPPPGTVIARSVDWEKAFLGSPSMEILSNGTYVFTHDNFNKHTDVYQSTDRGNTWAKVGQFDRQRSGTLFAIADVLYQVGYAMPEIKGVSPSCVAIRKSTDGGKTWSEPVDAKTGLLLSDASYYTDPVPVLVHRGRVWWQVDLVDRSRKADWPGQFGMMAISAPMDSDLLDAANWTRSNAVPWPSHRHFTGWLEGNVVAAPDGSLHILARVEDRKRPGGGGRTVARLDLSADGKTLRFDPENGFLDFPGGAAKFCIRYDDVSRKYWALTNWVQPGQKGARTTLALVCSDDLKDWDVRSIIYQHAKGNDVAGFQYCDWRIIGDDVHFVCRLGWYGKNFHDSNYMIFDTIKHFRRRTRQDDAKRFE